MAAGRLGESDAAAPLEGHLGGPDCTHPGARHDRADRGRSRSGHRHSERSPERLMRPLEAYETVMRFAAERGEPALRLALHAAVPQSFRPGFLHLLRLNFVPEAAHE